MMEGAKETAGPLKVVLLRGRKTNSCQPEVDVKPDTAPTDPCGAFSRSDFGKSARLDRKRGQAGHSATDGALRQSLGK
jgi:hypothetical protein